MALPLMALLLGMSVFFIRPALPVQIDQPVDNADLSFFGMDNPAIELDQNMEAPKKCQSL